MDARKVRRGPKEELRSRGLGPGAGGDGEKWLECSFIQEVNSTSLGDGDEGE